jgi:outer membrane protein OmpA-like peptidoglycan-associated protein
MRNHILKRAATCFVVLVVHVLSFGQDDAKLQDLYEREADYLFSMKDYVSAKYAYGFLDSLYPGKALYSYRLGECAYKSPQPFTCVPFFLKAKEQGATDPELLFYLGRSYHFSHNFPEAIRYYSKYKKLLATNPSEDQQDHLKNTERYLAQCNVGVELVNNPLELEINNIGEKVNTKYAEYVPLVDSAESILVFTSRRKNGTSNVIEPSTGMYYEDVYISYKVNDTWRRPQNLGSTINGKFHDACVSLSPDGRKIYIYRAGQSKSNSGIYLTEFKRDENGRLVWSKPEKLDHPYINNKKSYVPSVSVSADGSQIFFTSDKEGGIGGLDLYVTQIGPDGKWTKPENMGAGINTDQDEDAPYIHPSGRLLFFSSKGHSNIGGYDVFFSALDTMTGEWGPPANFGYPVNTAHDDIYFFWSADESKGYYSSFRLDSYGEKDIYTATRPEGDPNMTVLKGYVTDSLTGEPIKAMVVITDKDTKEIVDRVATDSNGRYVGKVKTNNTYNVLIEADGYVFHEQEVFVEKRPGYFEITENVNVQPYGMQSMVGDSLVVTRQSNLMFDGTVIPGVYDIEDREVKVEIDGKEVTIRLAEHGDDVVVVDDKLIVKKDIVIDGVDIAPGDYRVAEDQFVLVTGTGDTSLIHSGNFPGHAIGDQVSVSSESSADFDNGTIPGEFKVDLREFKIKVEGILITYAPTSNDDVYDVEGDKIIIKKSVEIPGYGTLEPGEYQLEEDNLVITANGETLRLDGSLFPDKDVGDQLQAVIDNEEIEFDGMMSPGGYLVKSIEGEDVILVAEDGQEVRVSKASLGGEIEEGQDVFIAGGNGVEVDGAVIPGTYEIVDMNEAGGFVAISAAGDTIVLSADAVDESMIGESVVLGGSQRELSFDGILLPGEYAVESHKIVVEVDGQRVELDGADYPDAYEIVNGKLMLNKEVEIEGYGSLGPGAFDIKENSIVLNIDGESKRYDGNHFPDPFNINDNRVSVNTSIVMNDNVASGQYSASTEVIKVIKDGQITSLEDAIEEINAYNEGAKLKEGNKIMFRSIYFDFNSWKIKEESRESLLKMKGLIDANSGVIVEISGHTDEVGSKRYNKRLSKKRAKAVAQYLIKELDVSKKSVVAVGYGETEPYVANTDEISRGLNRRTEFKVISKDKIDTYGDEMIPTHELLSELPIVKYSAEELQRLHETHARKNLDAISGDILKWKVHFPFGEWGHITDYSQNKLRKVIQYLNFNPDVKLVIHSHADPLGHYETNRVVADKRGQTVFDFMIEHGVNPDRLEIASYGADIPLVQSSDKQQNVVNRRVEFEVYK